MYALRVDLEGQVRADDREPAIEGDRRGGFRSREEALKRSETGTIVRLQVKTDRSGRKPVALCCGERIRDGCVGLAGQNARD